APGVPPFVPDPAAGCPTIVGRRGFNVGTYLDRRGRRGQVGGLAHGGVSPIPGSPLKTLRGFSPIAGHPLAAWRQGTPHATDPKKIVSLVIPGPVAGNPRDIGPLGVLVRRHLLDSLWRRFGYHHARLRIERDNPRKRLMHGPACKHLDPLRITRIGRFGTAYGA